MSYILDALRKSEQQRKQGAEPARPLELQLAPEPAGRRPIRWAAGAVAAAFAAAAWWWLASPGPGLRIASEPAPAPSGARTVPPVRPPEVAARPAETVPADPVEPVPATPPVSPVVAPVPVPVPVTRPAVPVVEMPAPPVAAEAPKPVARITPLADLPPEVRQAIPAMTIAMHSYSENAAERMVMVNGRILREGDELAPGLRLEAVMPDGLLFVYRGYRIQRGLH